MCCRRCSPPCQSSPSLPVPVPAPAWRCGSAADSATGCSGQSSVRCGLFRRLEPSSDSAVRADTAFRCLVFLDGALCHLKPELQHMITIGKCRMIFFTVIKKEVLLNTGGILFENSPNASKPLYRSCSIFQAHFSVQPRPGHQHTDPSAHRITEHIIELCDAKSRNILGRFDCHRHQKWNK